jgi:hypothetical protein
MVLVCNTFHWGVNGGVGYDVDVDVGTGSVVVVLSP